LVLVFQGMLMFNSWRLVLRGGIRFFLVAVAVTYSALAPALGLGEITLYSALNQPLRADIALVDAEGLDENDLSASLAGVDEFQRAGVERAAFLNGLQFTPVQRGNLSLIRVTSSQPVDEPFLNFLVQLNQANGRLVREYTLLLDPPGSVSLSAEPAIPPVAAPSIQSDVAAQPATAPSTPGPLSIASPPVAQVDTSGAENLRLQAAIDDLKTRLAEQDEQIAEQKNQLNELQKQWQEEKRASPQPVVPTAADDSGTDWRMVIGLPALMVMLVLGWLVRRSRLRDHPESGQTLPWEEFNQQPPAPTWQEPGLNLKDFQDVPKERPKPELPLVMAAVTPPVAALAQVAFDEYQLNLQEPPSRPGAFDLPDTSGLSLSLEPLHLEPQDASV
jgi:pilus assembly protein FimV